jgi:hypothetical protein
MIKTETVITFINDDLDIRLPYQPLDLLPLPKDGVMVDDEELRFAIYDLDVEWEYLHDADDDIVFDDYSETGLVDPIQKIPDLTTQGYQVYLVKKYDHILVEYDIYDETSMDELSWDSKIAGIIGIKGYADPRSAAKSYLKKYSHWYNGMVYAVVTVPIDTPDEWSVCRGFISDDAVEAVFNGV